MKKRGEVCLKHFKIGVIARAVWQGDVQRTWDLLIGIILGPVDGKREDSGIVLEHCSGAIALVDVTVDHRSS